MITRLQIDGFKNLVDVDVRFGAFTCVAGVNGTGKSNLFDAILFLGALADRPLLDAAASVRDERGHTGDPRSIFRRTGDSICRSMRFGVEMLSPAEADDDLGQHAAASARLLRYELELALQEETDNGMRGEKLRVVRESLIALKKGDAAIHLAFPHTREWRSSVVIGTGRRSPFISTEESEGLVRVHQEQSQGRALRLRADSLTRTALSGTDSQFPTALCARRELSSWQLMQLEPASLRSPDSFNAPVHITAEGLHMPAALYRMAVVDKALERPGKTYCEVTNRLRELIDDVRSVRVDRDEKRELLTLYVADRERTEHAARALSDGTLRFLALAVLESDVRNEGVICLEEPENGIHPSRIVSMLQLLQDIAVDVECAVSETNPLRQVIVNTHSPTVVQEVDEDTVVVVESVEAMHDGQIVRRAQFSSLPNTWRCVKAKPPCGATARGALLSYLSPVQKKSGVKDRRRVADREDLQILLPLTN